MTASNTTPSALREAIWNEWLTCRFNLKYYTALRRRYLLRDQVLRAILAITSSSAITGLAFWSAFPNVWQGFLAGTAVVAIVTPILGYSKILGELGAGYGRWAQATVKCEALWDKVEAGSPVTVEELEGIKAGLLPALEAEIDVPIDEDLRNGCFRKVLEEQGLSEK